MEFLNLSFAKILELISLYVRRRTIFILIIHADFLIFPSAYFLIFLNFFLFIVLPILSTRKVVL